MAAEEKEEDDDTGFFSNKTFAVTKNSRLLLSFRLRKVVFISKLITKNYKGTVFFLLS